MAEDKKEKSSDLLSRGKKAFHRCNDYEKENRQTALDDIKFSRLSQQWPSDIVKQRELEQRPVLTVNRMKTFIRQVVNDSRQNKPQIKVHPVDSGADPKTADVINGLIRNIEYTSNADVAYDTAIEQSVSGGFGYWRISLDYAYEDTFDMDLGIERISNQFSVYGDPDCMGADSADWNVAFIVERLSKEQFKAQYGKKKNIDGKAIDVDLDSNSPLPVDFDSDSWAALNNTWVNDDGVMIAEWWTREEAEEEIVKLSNGHIYCAEELTEDAEKQAVEDEDAERYEDVGTDDHMEMIRAGLALGTLTIVGRRTRKVHKVKQVIMTGADVLEVNEWPGRYIPIIPVYGDEIIVEGKRFFRSLIHDAKDSQRMFNYWQSTATELVALAPRTPWIGRKGTFDSDAGRWATANTQSHAYLEFDGEKPERQPLDGGQAVGAISQAMAQSDNMKSIIGLYDASLGAKSNETSGRAIMARQREGDVATFHFVDNLSRAIRHTGRVLIDLIPRVYTAERIVRIIGEDGKAKTVQINGKEPQPQIGPDGKPVQDEKGEVIMAIHDLTAGKYDLTVTTGPSFTTRREEAAAQMTELVRAFPQAAPFVADIMARNFDWPGADEIAKRFEAMNPANQQQIPPQIQQQMQEMQQALQKLSQENNNLKQGHDIKAFDAETNRLKVTGDLQLDQADTGLKLLQAASPQTPPTTNR